MDPQRNPFAPGAGTQPPELTGREVILEGAALALARVRIARSARSQMLLGLRGVGKTVLLNRLQELAENEGYLTIVVEAPEGRRLADMLVPPLRSALVKLSRVDNARDVARRGLAVLRAFAAAFKVTVGDVEFGVGSESGTADSGNLEADLQELLVAIAEAARLAEKPVALLIDEVQYLEVEDLAALIVAMHKVAQKGLPLITFGAGLPQLAGLAGDAKSYAERLFHFVNLGPLADVDARAAIRNPVEREGATITDAALDVIVERTKGYPYFLQEWGSHSWNAAKGSTITANDAQAATKAALEQLDQGFFRVRFDRLTPREKEYMRAMAELGVGPHRSGDVAGRLQIAVTSAAPLRSGLIRKGMIYSPQHGDTAFTVPMFDEFLKRVMPTPTRDHDASAGPGRRGSRKEKQA